MDEKCPKRRKDKYNPDRITKKDGYHFLFFKDGQLVKYNAAHKTAILEHIWEACYPLSHCIIYRQRRSHPHKSAGAKVKYFVGSSRNGSDS